MRSVISVIGSIEGRVPCLRSVVGIACWNLSELRSLSGIRELNMGQQNTVSHVRHDNPNTGPTPETCNSLKPPDQLRAVRGDGCEEVQFSS